MMLSRAAERVYWLGRYLERAENTARIVQQYSQLLLDLPIESGTDWHELIRIFGAADDMEEAPTGTGEAAIINYLLAQASSPSSLIYCLQMARENLRNTRDLLPTEAWENVNELYQYARDQLPAAAKGEDRFEVLSQCIARCQQINGALITTMSHHSPLQFLRLGQNLERADMTTRVIDVAANYLTHSESLGKRYRSTLWTNVLKSVSGFQMYRQYVQITVSGPSVIRFLTNDPAFPRTIRRCIDVAASSADKLPINHVVLACLAEVPAELDAIDVESLDAAGVSQLMDTLQKDLARAHTEVANTWFLRAKNT